MNLILRACGLPNKAPPPPPSVEPAAWRRRGTLPVSPLVDLPVSALWRCALFGELSTFHGLIVVMGHSRRRAAATLKGIMRDDPSRPSALFSDARDVQMQYTDDDHHRATPSRRKWCIPWACTDLRLSTEYLRLSAEALEREEESHWPEDGESFAGRRAAAIRCVLETAVYHGVASINGTNKDVGGHETVALVSVARPAARCSLDASEAPRVLFVVSSAEATTGKGCGDGQVYESMGVYAVLGAGGNERRAALVDAAWELLDPEGTGFVERESFLDAYDASRHPRVFVDGEVDEYRKQQIEKALRVLCKRHTGLDRAGHVSRREFETYCAECPEEDDEAFERLLDVWTAGETLSVERSSEPAAPSPMRPGSRIVRLVHTFWPQEDRNFDNGDDHEYLHTATYETCEDVSELLGVDYFDLGHVIKAVALVANLRGRADDQWEHLERSSKHYAPPSRRSERLRYSEFCDDFPRFERDTGKSEKWGSTVAYPEGKDLFYRLPGGQGSRDINGRGSWRAADHEFSYRHESAHGLLRQVVAEVSTRVDLEACASLETLHDKLRGWREVVRARLRRQHPAVLQEWEEGPVQDHFAFEYSTQHWRGV